ncbi:trihelix transcription factor ASIL2-like [Chenopodium quinoa]|uniref:trihelix transcription factor ASIL2-like n=1 Tax=Chenopodium quinoa TaxID=63459 RepID=UPI000B7870F8|nr:trihelix transcription factor ASIL2-like [Chenopodium quinoa]
MEKETNQDDQNPSPTKLEQSPRKPLLVGGSSGGDRLKRDEWSEGAVSSLLEAYESKWILRNRAKLKGQDWEDVAKHVSSRANNTKSPKTQTQCKNKIESMKKRYRSESATADTSSWPLFSRLDNLLRGTGGSTGLPSAHSSPMKAIAVSSNPGLVLESSPVALQLPPLPIPLPVPPQQAPPPVEIAQNSHESNGAEPMAKDCDEVAAKVSDQISDKNHNDDDHIETDSSTPALYSDDKNGPKLKKLMKMKRKKRRREENSSWEDVSESIRWLGEAVVRSEQVRMDTMRELERMRVEAEAKRGEMDLKRTEIIANTQLEIARLFASTTGKSVDSSLRIGRS